MKTALFTIVAASLALASCTQQSADEMTSHSSSDNYERIQGISYGNRERNTLDLYLPSEREGAPVLIFVHGGRWYRNDSTQIELYDRVDQLTDAGFVIASINMTYSSEAVWPAQLEDALAAIDFVQAQSESYGYDGENLSLWGQSSGAHVAMMATLELAEQGQSPIKSLVHWYGPSDLLMIRQDRIDDDVPGENDKFDEPSPEAQLLGAPLSQIENLAAKANPVRRIQELPQEVTLPPVLLVHGEEDFVISPLQTTRLDGALKARPNASPVVLRSVPNAGHGGEGFDQETAPAIEFLKRYAPR